MIAPRNPCPCPASGAIRFDVLSTEYLITIGGGASVANPGPPGRASEGDAPPSLEEYGKKYSQRDAAARFQQDSKTFINSHPGLPKQTETFLKQQTEWAGVILMDPNSAPAKKQ